MSAEGQSKEAAGHDFFQHARPSLPLQRFITTDEVANMVVYPAGPLVAATNGASVRVDGGVVRSIGQRPRRLPYPLLNFQVSLLPCWPARRGAVRRGWGRAGAAGNG